MLKGYDYTLLAPKDFELLSQDIVQRKISIELGKDIVFSSFTEGKDKGKDGLYQDQDYQIILQAKRYSH
ncbi:MAG: hypothetical protein ACXVJE_05865 [Mucilaginibacter sp.]